MTYWYSNRKNVKEALWIKNHIRALAPFVDDQFVFHFQISRTNRFFLCTDKLDQRHSSFILSAPLAWWLVEILSGIGLAYLLFVRARKYDIVNVHIAYPLLTHYNLISRWVRKPIVITEHWSGYHYNFGVKKKLLRAQGIFKNDLPLLAVSNSLLADIRDFSGRSLSNVRVIPNCIDSTIFRLKRGLRSTSKSFLMLSYWKWPKRPNLIIQAFSKYVLKEDRANYQLRIGGFGPQLPEMKSLIDTLGLQNNVIFLGAIDSERVAFEMNNCLAFLHASDYETFSVVCAEAISCGVPAVVSAVGGLPEFVNDRNGILVFNNTVENWLQALETIDDIGFDYLKISQRAVQEFSFATVGQKYFNFLTEVCDIHG